MQVLLDLFINNGIISIYEIKTYTDLHEICQEYEMLVYNPDKNMLGMYDSFIANRNFVLIDSYTVSISTEEELEERIKTVYSNYIFYEFNDYTTYCPYNSEKKIVKDHFSSTLKMFIIKQSENVTENTKLENIYVVEHKIIVDDDNEDNYTFMFRMLSDFNEPDIDYDTPFLEIDDDSKQAFTISNIGSYI